MSDSSNLSDDEGPSSSKKSKLTKKKTSYKQKFRAEWLKNKDFSSWLREDLKDPYKAMCSFCDTTIQADISVLQRHCAGKKHQNKLKGMSKQQPISKLLQTSKILAEEEKVKYAELKLAAFMAEHKIPHASMDHLSDLLVDAFPDSNIAKNLKMKHTKLQVVINNVLGDSEKEYLCADLKSQKFSVLIDESTDISSTKTMCVVVRYYDLKIGRVVSRFWDLIDLFSDDNVDHTTTAKRLFEVVIKSFEDCSIPLKNIVGFGSDGCNTMMGCNNSVSTRFRESCPGIVVLKCICHSLHLCSSEACRELPQECETLARNIYNHFKNSSKRQSQLKAFQEFCDTKVHKILRPAQTRWLSLSSVVNRILEQWEALALYFDDKWLEDHESRELHIALRDPIQKAYFYFLSWMLPKFTKTNAYFQNENTVIINMHVKMQELYRELLLLIMPTSYVNNTPLDAIDPTDESKHLQIDNIYLGLGVEKQLLLPEVINDATAVKNLRKNCKQFIVKSAVGIRKRYSLDDQLLNAISTFDIENCISVSEKRQKSLNSIFKLLPRIAPKTLEAQQTIDDEWRHFPNYIQQNKCQLNVNDPPDVFWHHVSEMKTKEESPPFFNLARFMLGMLSLPHSNADCERIFSHITDLKTKKRNQMSTKSIAGNLFTQQVIKRHGKTCVDFHPTYEMIKKINISMYK